MEDCIVLAQSVGVKSQKDLMQFIYMGKQLDTRKENLS
jgi:hypothetical protein